MSSSRHRHRIRVLLFLFGALILLDMTGYHLLTGADWLESLYMTIISITTVGFGEIVPLGRSGRLFTIFVILSGLSLFLYTTSLMVENTVSTLMGRRSRRRIERMKDHIIICGYGRMGESVARQMATVGTRRILILEQDPLRQQEAQDAGHEVLGGDATATETLLRAGVERAAGFVALLSTDADNIFTIMSARELNADIHLIARSYAPNSESKLLRVGADRVISPYELSARRITNSVLKPHVVSFIDLASETTGLSLSVEELTIHEHHQLSGRTIRDSGLREKHGAIVVAISRNGRMHYTPGPEETICPGDVLVLFGERQKLVALA